MDNPQHTIVDAIYWNIGDEICSGANDTITTGMITMAIGTGKAFRCGFRAESRNVKAIEEIYSKYPNKKGVVFVSLQHRYANDIMTNGGNLSEWDKIVWLGYMALRSIDGRREGKKTARNPMKANNSLMWARMAGYKTWGEYKSAKTNEAATLDRYMTEYYANRLRNVIQDKFKSVKVYAKHVKGFYFTTKHDVSMYDVVKYALSKKMKVSEQARRAEIERMEHEATMELIKGEAAKTAIERMSTPQEDNTTQPQQKQYRKNYYRNRNGYIDPARRPITYNGGESTDPADF